MIPTPKNRLFLLSILVLVLGDASASYASDAPRAGTVQTSGYNKGFYIVSPDGKFKLKIQSRIQGRYTYEVVEGHDESAYSIPRARFKFSGNVYGKTVKYKIETDFAKGAVNLKDYMVDFELMPKSLYLRMGQSKRPYSRQQLTSSGKQSFIERAITDKAFGSGRDIGLTLQNNYIKSPTFEWALGFYNGTGDKGELEGDVETNLATGEGEIVKGKLNNIPKIFNPQVVLRLGYNYGGIKGYTQPDFEGGGFRMGLAASTILNLDQDNDKDADLTSEVDFMIKMYGFSTSGAYFIKTTQNGPGIDEQKFDSWGAQVQAGYLIAKKYEPVLRYAIVDTADEKKTEMALGFSWHFKKHNLKWQADLGQLATTENSSTEEDYRIRTQMQVAF